MKPKPAAPRSPRPAACAWLVIAFALVAAGCSTRKDADRVGALLGVRPGMTVADFGAGQGEITVILARRVGPSGHVFATEIDPDNVRAIRAAVARAGVGNVTVIQDTASDSGLAPGCCDAILMRGVYHHLTDPAAIDASLFRALRPGGKLAILDFRPTILLAPWTPSGIPADRGGHSVNPDIVTAEVVQAGLKPLDTVDPWPGSWPLSNYCLIFEKPAAPAAAADRSDDAPSAGRG